MSFTTSYETAVPNADVVFIAVGTPTGEGGGAPNLRYVEAAARPWANTWGPASP